MKILSINVFFTCLFMLLSCSNEDDFNDLTIVVDDSQIINLGGKQIQKKGGVLAFESKEELETVAKGLLPLCQTKSADGLLSVDRSQINELKKKDLLLFMIFTKLR